MPAIDQFPKSEEWFSTTLNAIGDGVIGIDVDGNIRYLNCIAEKLTGWDSKKAIGCAIEEVYDISHKLTGEKASNPAREALRSEQNGKLPQQSVLVQQSGALVSVEESGTPVRDASGDIIGSVLIFRDVTEKESREQELIQYQHHLESLVQKRTEALDRRVEFERMVVRISSDLIQSNKDNHELGLQKAISQVGEFLGLNACGIFEITQNDGVDALSPVSIWTSDPTDASTARGSLVRSSDLQIFCHQFEDDGQVVVHDTKRILEGSHAELEKVNLFQMRSFVSLRIGPVLPMKWVVTFGCEEAQDWSEEKMVLLTIFADILKSVLKRHELEREQRNLQEQLTQSQKLEAIGKLTGGIAHDFNNMLVPILGYADAIITNEASGFNKGDIIEIRKAARSAASLTRQLLAFSRKQILDKKPLSLNHLVNDMEQFLTRILGEDIVFELDLADDLMAIEADRSQLEQVLMNLCVNARDAMPEGGKLSICTRTAQSSNGKRVTHFEVADNGSGMSKDLLDKIFDPFFTTKGMEGTGLGLSVVLGIIEQHEGTIRVQSELGEGTRFIVAIPSTEQETATNRSEDSQAALEAIGEGQRILLVEDEPGVLLFVSRALERCGYEITSATKKTAAIETFDREAGKFDMVFTDAKLPDGNGIEVLEHILAKRPSMPALISSGYTDDRSLVDQARQRGVEFLQKPYELGELYETVKGVLDQDKIELAG